MGPLTLTIDLGPPKGSEPRGVVTVRVTPTTRFNLSGGVRGSTLLGSLGQQRLGGGVPLSVSLDPRRHPDGSYTLLELTTITR